MIKVITKKNNLKKLAKAAAKLEKAKSEYGYFQSQGKHHSGLSYPALMAIHEYGAGNIPARKPFSIAIFNSGKGLMKLTMRELDKYITSSARGVRYPIDGALNTFGSMGVYYTKSLFGSSQLIPNAPATVARKGRNDPLVDLGDLRDHMTWRTSESEGLK